MKSPDRSQFDGGRNTQGGLARARPITGPSCLARMPTGTAPKRLRAQREVGENGMKRITCAFGLLIGLGGCASPNIPHYRGEKGPGPANQGAPGLPPGITALPGPVGPTPGALPTNPQWTPSPGQVVARPPAPKPLPPGA